MKYYLPWERLQIIKKDWICYVRQAIGDAYHDVSVFSGSERLACGWSYRIGTLYFASVSGSAEDTMKMVDARLQSDGDYCIREGEVERFRKLDILL